MTLNLPAKVRAPLYVIGFIGTPTMAYLFDEGVVNAFWFGLWNVVAMAVFALARINVTPDKK